jgi:hypothetical protein
MAVGEPSSFGHAKIRQHSIDRDKLE